MLDWLTDPFASDLMRRALAEVLILGARLRPARRLGAALPAELCRGVALARDAAGPGDRRTRGCATVAGGRGRGAGRRGRDRAGEPRRAARWRCRRGGGDRRRSSASARCSRSRPTCRRGSASCSSATCSASPGPTSSRPRCWPAAWPSRWCSAHRRLALSVFDRDRGAVARRAARPLGARPARPAGDLHRRRGARTGQPARRRADPRAGRRGAESRGARCPPRSASPPRSRGSPGRSACSSPTTGRSPPERRSRSRQWACSRSRSSCPPLGIPNIRLHEDQWDLRRWLRVAAAGRLRWDDDSEPAETRPPRRRRRPPRPTWAPSRSTCSATRRAWRS